MIDRGLAWTGGLVKICGLRHPEHAVAAVESGADLLGFVFAPSRRQVGLVEARMAVEAARARAGSRLVLAVGVFVDATDRAMETTIDRVGLDLVQLHGSVGLPAKPLSRPVLRALRTSPGTTVASLLQEIATLIASTGAPAAWLVDGYDPVAHGGTGKRADWALAAELAKAVPLVLAGGLNPENIAQAIGAVRPLAVDVSGGVETDGGKDPVKIAAFVQAARAAFDSLAAPITPG